MTRIAIVLTTLVLACGLLGCGGGSGAPAPDNSGGGTQPAKVQSPERILGDHSVSSIPDQLNIATGASGAELSDIVGRYGCTVIGQNHGWATIQLPGGADPSIMATTLEKEYNITKAEPVRRTLAPRLDYPGLAAKQSSYVPEYSPFYGEQFLGFDIFDTDGDQTPDTWGFGRFIGQALPMNIMGFNAAWDVLIQIPAPPPDQVVRVAIIDAGWFDYSVEDRGTSFNVAQLDADNCGFIASDGTHTPGLTAAHWDLNDDGDVANADYPFRDTGERMLGIIGAAVNSNDLQANDIDAFNGATPDGIQEDEIWNEGIAGINPTANLILIKTGSLTGTAPDQTWSFSDNDLAEAIAYAAADTADTNGGKWPNGGANADIVVIGWFGTGAVGGNVSTAIQTARDNNVLVIAPAGDVVDSYDAGAFTDTPVDIGVTSITPASDPNIVSVAGAGLDRHGVLGDVTVGADTFPNDAIGYNPLFFAPFDGPHSEIASFCNTGATIAASAFALGFSYHPRLVTGAGTLADPQRLMPGETYNYTLGSFSSANAAAYVAGAASIVFQALYSANATPPTDDEVLSELLTTVQFSGMAGLQGTSGLLNAGSAAFSGLSGGGLQTVLPALSIESAVLSQPLVAVTRATDVSLTVTVADGTGPFKMEVDWGDGNGFITTEPWTNGDPVTLTGGYEDLGLNAINFRVTDDNDLVAGTGFVIFVINPLGMGITVTDVTGAGVGGNPVPLAVGTSYRFSANPTNLYTGDIGGTPNVTTFSWDFNGDATEDATGASPVFAFGTAGAYTLALTVTEAVRPDTQWTVDVQVN